MGKAPATDIHAALARIERSQAQFEQVARRILDCLVMHDEKLVAILEAATKKPEPSPVAEALAAILESMKEQRALLEGLPEAIGVTIRDEVQREAEEELFEPSAGWDAEPEVGH